MADNRFTIYACKYSLGAYVYTDYMTSDFFHFKIIIKRETQQHTPERAKKLNVGRLPFGYFFKESTTLYASIFRNHTQKQVKYTIRQDGQTVQARAKVGFSCHFLFIPN